MLDAWETRSSLASTTSVTVTMTCAVAELPLASVALTVASYRLSPVASAGASKSRPGRVRTPVAPPISKWPASAPSLVHDTVPTGLPVAEGVADVHVVFSAIEAFESPVTASETLVEGS